MAKGDGLEALLGVAALTSLGLLATAIFSPAQAKRPVRPARTKLFDSEMPRLQHLFLSALTNWRGDVPVAWPYQAAQARQNIEGYLVHTAARVHREVVYVPDERTSGMKDYWQSPQETLASGMGDCEDHAMVIFRRLKEAGFTFVDLVVGLWGSAGHAWVEVVGANNQRYVLEGTNGRTYRGRPTEYTPGVWMTMSGYRMEEFGSEIPVVQQPPWYS